MESLTADLLEKTMVVLSPVFGGRFDAIDVAVRLVDHGYSGRYVAVAPQIADPSMVLREVAAFAPGLSFDIVETGRGPHDTQPFPVQKGPIDKTA